MKSILIVDDQAFDITLMSTYLDEFKLYTAMNGKSAIDIVNSYDIDLILMDMKMPDMDGCETCYQLKQDVKTKDIPVIFVTGMADEESIVKAYDAGGVDYVTKPIKERELLARINTHLKLRESIQKLEILSYKDSMTNIFNRRRFFEITEEKFVESSSDLVAVMIDIDNFKAINDTYGHSTGDKVIKRVAELISEILPDDAIFGRIGGEEFAVVCRRPSAEMVSSRMDIIRALTSQSPVVAEDDTDVNFTISIGVSMSDKSMKSIDALLSSADIALYDAKGTGRNKVIFRE